MKLHRFLGITLVFFVMILSITGTLLQHAEEFGIRQKFISSSLTSNLYNIKPCTVSSTKTGNKWISLCDSNLYFQENKIVNNIHSINAILKNNSQYTIQYNKSHEIVISDDGEIIISSINVNNYIKKKHVSILPLKMDDCNAFATIGLYQKSKTLNVKISNCMK